MVNLTLAAVMALHVLMAVLWTGGYLVTSMLVVPAAKRHDAPAFALDVLDSLKWFAFGGILLMGATGGAGLWLIYDNELPGGSRGTALVAMMTLYGVFALTSLWAWRETKQARAANVSELPTRLKMAFRTNALVATLLVLDAAVIGYVV
jgi:ABC-type Mn2+/Zn2+ transport system permease subunit